MVNGYIGVSGGYLGDFSYRTHAEFYPIYCDLDIDPNQYEGTTRERFMRILETSAPTAQKKILLGILEKYPLSYFPENERPDKMQIRMEIEEMISRLSNLMTLTMNISREYCEQ